MARRRNAFVQGLFRVASIGFVRLTQAMPLSLARRLGILLGDLAYFVVPRIRRIGMDNLNLAYGDELSLTEKRRILREATRNVGIVAAEFGRIPQLKGERAHELIELEGLDLLDREGGAVLIGAHLANWEWMAPFIQCQGIPGAEIIRPLDDDRLNDFVDGLRRSTGLLTIPKHGAGIEVFRLLSEGYTIGILVDQNPRHNASPVTFFGRETWATIAAPMIALRSSTRIHPVHMVRLPDGRYRIEIRPALDMVRSDDLRQDLIENTQRCQDAIEEMIRANPGQWLWLHDRWKPRPRLAADWAEKLGMPVSP